MTAFDRDNDAAEGLNSTGGLMARSAVGRSLDKEEVFAGPVFEGDIDRALSTTLSSDGAEQIKV